MSLGHTSEATRTPAIVRLPAAADEPSAKLIELYMADCSKNGSIRAKQLKFSG